MHQDRLEDNIEKLDLDLCLQYIGFPTFYNSDQFSETVLHCIVTHDGEYQDIRVVFASPYVEQRIISRYEKGMQHIMTKFIKDREGVTEHLATSRGYVFETVAHRILQRGGDFYVCFLLVRCQGLN